MMKTTTKGIYSETLQSIIDAKLAELVKKRDAFETRKREVIDACESQPDEAKQLWSLLDGVKRCFQIKQNKDGDLITSETGQSDLLQLLTNLEKFLRQPRYDTSISRTVLTNWKTSMLQELDAQSARYEYASLYARIVTEWLLSEQGPRRQPPDDDQDMTDDFEEMESAAKLESRQKWEETVFTPYDSPVDDIHAFLTKLFGVNDPEKEMLHKAFKTLKSDVSAFETELLAPGQFNEHTIKLCIDSLVASGRLDNNKLQVLKDFQNNDIILSEVADVLNLRLSNLDHWSWGDSVPVEQRRRLAGFYSNEMNEELLQAIFLQYIGTRWAVFFRQKLAVLVDTNGAWISAKQDIPTVEHQRRQYYLGAQSMKPSVRSERHRIWRSQYFLCQLPRTQTQKIQWKDGDEEADYGSSKKKKRTAASSEAPRMQMMSRAAAYAMPPPPGGPAGTRGGAKRHRRIGPIAADEEDEGSSADEDGPEDFRDNDSATRNLMQSKQGLLHLLKTEVLINVKLYGNLTAFRGQFKQWDLMLPHASIMAVLSFLGVSKQWQKFLATFLEAPLSFTQGDLKETPRNRQRGVPEHHPLSDALGEVVLFCLDLLINQECKGSKLWRIHDDFWFWSPDSRTAAKAWTSISKFGQLFGIPLDEDKAGSAQIGTVTKSTFQEERVLPKDPIRWGFLYLNAKSGEFDIDQSMVDNHVAELKRQLHEKSSKGIISWIQAWNAYAITFFSTNFGKPAVCFGPGHMEKILMTLDRMQKQVFDGSNMVQYLTNTIKQRYNVNDIPDGYVYFPTQAGGLELRNPFIIPLLLEQALRDNDPAEGLETWQTSEKEAYQRAKKRFDKHVTQGTLAQGGLHHRNEYTPSANDKHTFFTFEEYTKYREDYTYEEDTDRNPLWHLYKLMLEEPRAERIDLSSEISKAVHSSSVASLLNSYDPANEDPPYWLWVCQVYGPEILRKFGGMNIVDPGVLPIGMVGLLKGDRVEWK